MMQKSATAAISIGMLIFSELTLLDLVGPLELFAATPGLQPILIGVDTHDVFADRMPQIRLSPEFQLTNAPSLDVLFIPGGAGIRHLLGSKSILQLIAEVGANARYCVSVCTGALVLGAAGLLRGYAATTHWRYLDLLSLVGASPCAERIVIDRDRITGGGVTAGLDFGLQLIALLLDTAAAERVQLQLEYDPAPPFQAGHPRSATASLVHGVQETTAAVYHERAALLTAISDR